MPRTTQEQVAAIIDLDPSIGLDPFIAAASALVDRIDGIEDSDALLVETWLAAHFYAMRDPRTVSERAGSVGATYQSKIGFNLMLSHYGQMAMTLDPTGALRRMSNGTPQTQVFWLGTDLEG